MTPSLEPSTPTTAAFKFVTALAVELSEGIVDLPAFPKVVERVRRALEDPNHTVEQIARIVGGEPALAARLLAIANSATFTSIGRPVTELRTAVNRLGDDLLRSTVLAFAMQQVRQRITVKSIEPQLQALWTESSRVAALCYVLARRSGAVADEAFLTGLLHGIGKFYILVRVSQQPGLAEDRTALGAIVRDWHAQIAKAVLENWNFPEKMTEAVAEQEDLGRKHYGQGNLADVLLCAILILRWNADEAALRGCLDQVEAFGQLQLDVAQCRVALEEADQRVTALREALSDV